MEKNNALKNDVPIEYLLDKAGLYVREWVGYELVMKMKSNDYTIMVCIDGVWTWYSKKDFMDLDIPQSDKDAIINHFSVRESESEYISTCPEARDRKMKYCDCDNPTRWVGDNYCTNCDGFMGVKHVIYHNVNTKFGFMDRIRILLGREVNIESEIHTEMETDVYPKRGKTTVRVDHMFIKKSEQQLVNHG